MHNEFDITTSTEVNELFVKRNLAQDFSSDLNFPIRYDQSQIESPVLDGIPAIVLKNCTLVLVLIITRLFQVFNNNGRLSDNWKTVRIQPISKKGSNEFLSNGKATVGNKSF